MLLSHKCHQKPMATLLAFTAHVCFSYRQLGSDAYLSFSKGTIVVKQYNQ